MSMRWNTILCLGGVALFVGLLVGRSPSGANAQLMPDNAAADRPERPLPDPRAGIFEPDQPGPSAIEHTDLSQREQDALARVKARYDAAHGNDVHQAWSQASRSAHEASRLHRAESEAGLIDVETLGVQ